MTFKLHRSRPSWRASEGRAIRPELWLIAMVVAGMLLVEVWQNSWMAELCLELDHSRALVGQSEARLDFARAELDRSTTRAELDPMAAELGLEPADAEHVVILPSDYLADRETPDRDRKPVAALAWAERAAGALVPEATARSRAGN